MGRIQQFLISTSVMTFGVLQFETHFLQVLFLFFDVKSGISMNSIKMAQKTQVHVTCQQKCYFLFLTQRLQALRGSIMAASKIKTREHSTLHKPVIPALGIQRLGESEVHGFPQLWNKYKASLGFMRPKDKKQKRNKDPGKAVYFHTQF